MSNYSDSSFHKDNANTSWYKVFYLIPKGSKVLDVGCSSGNFGAELINRRKCIVDGIEINAGDYKKAKTKLHNVYKLDVERDSLEALKEKYDIIYFGDVIEHLVNPVGTLRRVKQFLTPTGKVLFSIPNMAHVSVRLSLLKGDFEYTKTDLLDNTHLHFYSLDEVYRVFQEAGFEIDHIDFIKRDYPRTVIIEWLDGLGLKGDKNFYESLRKPEAAAYQFVGSAVMSKKRKNIKRKQFGPIDLFESYHSRTLKKLRDELNAAIQYRDQIIEQQNLQLELLKSSRFWKLRNLVARLVGKKVI